MTVNCYFCGHSFHSVLITASGIWPNAPDKAHTFVFCVYTRISIRSFVCTTIAVYLWKQVRGYSRICAKYKNLCYIVCIIYKANLEHDLHLTEPNAKTVAANDWVSSPLNYPGIFQKLKLDFLIRMPAQ